MATKLVGGCLCGGVRYEGSVAEAQGMHCFCKDCQRSTGSASATFVVVPQSQIEVTGTPRGYTKAGESGGSVTRYSCGECGSQLYSEVEVMPGMYFLKLGTLDDSSVVTPAVAIWTDSKPEWAHLEGLAATFGKNPTG